MERFVVVDSTLGSGKVVKGLGVMVTVPSKYAESVRDAMDRAYNKGYSSCKRELRGFLGVDEDLDIIREDLSDLKVRW